MYGLCNGREQEREAEKLLEEREKNGEKRRNLGPVTVINWDPRELSPDLNPTWIQKQAKGLTQIWHGTHIKFKLGFQSSLKNHVPNIFFFLVGPSDYGFESLNHDSNHVYQTGTKSHTEF